MILHRSMKIGGGFIIGVLVGGSEALLEIDDLTSFLGIFIILLSSFMLFLGVWFLSKPYGKIFKT